MWLRILFHLRSVLSLCSCGGSALLPDEDDLFDFLIVVICELLDEALELLARDHAIVVLVNELEPVGVFKVFDSFARGQTILELFFTKRAVIVHVKIFENTAEYRHGFRFGLERTDPDLREELLLHPVRFQI